MRCSSSLSVFFMCLGIVFGCGSDGAAGSDGGAIGATAPDAARDGAVAITMPTPSAAKLMLWVDATKGVDVEQGVLHWRDQSGNGNDLYDSDVNQWGYRGKAADQPAVICTACWLSATAASPGKGFSPMGAEFLLVAVVNADRTSPTVDGPFAHGFTIQAKEGIETRLDSSLDGASLYANFVETPASAAKIGGTHTLRLRRRAGGAMEVAVDGMASSSSKGEYSASIERVIFGTATRVVRDGNRRDADILEILGWIGEVSDGEIDDLESYFRAKYRSSL